MKQQNHIYHKHNLAIRQSHTQWIFCNITRRKLKKTFWECVTALHAAGKCTFWSLYRCFQLGPQKSLKILHIAESHSLFLTITTCSGTSSSPKNMCLSVFTLFAHASSSQDVSCSTLMISLISALIFSKVKFRFFKASSTPWLPDVFVVTKILIPRKSKGKLHCIDSLKYLEIWNKTSEQQIKKRSNVKKVMWGGGVDSPYLRWGWAAALWLCS